MKTRGTPSRKIPQHSTMAIAVSHAILEDQIQARIKEQPPTNADAIYPAHLCDPQHAILAELQMSQEEIAEAAKQTNASLDAFEAAERDIFSVAPVACCEYPSLHGGSDEWGTLTCERCGRTQETRS